jgi:HAD superfamily hydrolase (TIGR01549 family)
MLRAVAFDLWETLITNPPHQGRLQEAARLHRLAATLRGCGREVSDEDLHAAHREAWNRCQELYWSKDLDIPTRTQIAHLMERLEIDDVDESVVDELETVYAEAVLAAPPSLVDGAREILTWARERALRTGLISNTGRTPGSVLRRVLNDLGIGGMIDSAVFSNEAGLCKPQRAVFQRLTESLAVEPRQVVFVGDNVEVDVAGAKAMGMFAVLFVPSERGTAVAPPRGDGEPIEPDATIRSLIELPPILERLM